MSTILAAMFINSTEIYQFPPTQHWTVVGSTRIELILTILVPYENRQFEVMIPGIYEVSEIALILKSMCNDST